MTWYNSGTHWSNATQSSNFLSHKTAFFFKNEIVEMLVSLNSTSHIVCSVLRVVGTEPSNCCLKRLQHDDWLFCIISEMTTLKDGLTPWRHPHSLDNHLTSLRSIGRWPLRTKSLVNFYTERPPNRCSTHTQRCHLVSRHCIECCISEGKSVRRNGTVRNPPTNSPAITRRRICWTATWVTLSHHASLKNTRSVEGVLAPWPR